MDSMTRDATSPPPLTEAAQARYESFMADLEAGRRDVDEAIAAHERAWAQLVRAVAELQARRGFWSRLFGVR